MATQRTIQCIGITEEDAAHLRLLLRVMRTQLRDQWSWGTEVRADLVVVNTRRLMGESAMRRAQQREVACAQVIEPDDPKPTGLFLRKPFRRDAFVTLLNKIGRGPVAGLEIDTWSDEFFDLDLGDVDLSALEADHPGAQSEVTRHARPSRGAVPEGADPLPEPSRRADADRFERDAYDESEGDAATGGETAAGLGGEEAFDAVEEEGETPADPDATFPLAYYLGRGMFRGPARIALRGAPPLLVDPDDQLFWAQGTLPGLEPYAKVLLRFGDWKPLGRTDFEQARRGIAARPYARLLWMDRFIHSNGFLSRHFDPGGEFRLTNRLDLSLDYPRAFRVGSHMTTFRKLHEIARVSAVGLAEVFDVVNAYEAIGYLEARAREKPAAK